MSRSAVQRAKQVETSGIPELIWAVEIGKAIEERLGNRQGQRTDKLQENFPEVPSGIQTRDIAAEKAGFGNPKTYQQAKAIVDHGVPELVQAVDEGRVSVSAASAVAKEIRQEGTERRTGIHCVVPVFTAGFAPLTADVRSPKKKKKLQKCSWVYLEVLAQFPNVGLA